RMAGAQDGDGLAGVALPVGAEDIGHTVGNVAVQFGFTNRGKPVRTRWIWREPCARRVDHGIGPQLLRPLAVLEADFERGGVAPLALDLVETDAADRRDAR